MAAITLDRPRLDVGRVIGGTFGALGRNWARVLVVAVPLSVAPHLLGVWLARMAVAPRAPGLGAFVGYLERIWISSFIVLAPAVVLSLLLCRWVAADMEGGRKSFSLGDPKRLWALMLAAIVAQFAINLGELLLYLPAIVLTALWGVLAPAVVLEGAGPIQALARSAELTRHHLVRIVLIWLAYVLIYVALGFGLGAVMALTVSAVPSELRRATIPLISYTFTALLNAGDALLWFTTGPVLYFELLRLKSGIAGAGQAAIFD
jgi:hypothetical protein